ARFTSTKLRLLRSGRQSIEREASRHSNADPSDAPTSSPRQSHALGNILLSATARNVHPLPCTLHVEPAEAPHDSTESSFAGLPETFVNDDEPRQPERCEHETELERGLENEDSSTVARDETPDANALSPAVRRLVKQYGLDPSAIRGTGPNGRVRVADVIASLGGRTDERGDDERAFGDAARSRPPLGPTDPTSIDTVERPGERGAMLDPGRASTAAAFTVFDAGLDAWLEHRKHRRAQGIDLPLLAYFAAAAAAALPAFPELASPSPRLDVIRSAEHGAIGTIVLGAEDLVSLEAIARALSGGGRQAAEDRGSRFALHDYSASGCLLTAPLPLPPNGAAVLGIGRPHHGFVPAGVDGDRTPRVGTRCMLTLTYNSRRIPLERANAFVARLVRYRP